MNATSEGEKLSDCELANRAYSNLIFLLPLRT